MPAQRLHSHMITRGPDGTFRVALPREVTARVEAGTRVVLHNRHEELPGRVARLEKSGSVTIAYVAATDEEAAARAHRRAEGRWARQQVAETVTAPFRLLGRVLLAAMSVLFVLYLLSVLTGLDTV